MSRFADRTVVVTGATGGLGRAIAAAFAAEGAHVYAGHRTPGAALDATLAALGERGGPLRFDVTQPDQVEAAFAEVHRARGRVDVLVNNAGVTRDAPALLVERDDWREVMAVNLDGAHACTRAVLPPMMHARRGAIVNVASVAALRASPGQTAYAASKGGLLALGRTLAAELAPRGIRVNTVVPGLIDAGMVQRMDHRARQRALDHVPLGRLGSAVDVARAVLFLASDEAAYVVGCELTVDGGLTL